MSIFVCVERTRPAIGLPADRERPTRILAAAPSRRQTICLHAAQAMKKILCAFILLVMLPVATHADERLLLNAFGETATAYVNDAFLLLGTTADCYVADIIPKDTAAEIVANVQKRIQVIRSKCKAVTRVPMSGVDRDLLVLLESAYACMDDQAWALGRYVADKTPEAAKRFEDKRKECLKRIEEISAFYSKLPPLGDAPRSTR
ncbi:MAG: hypothetical protein AB1646_02130 [Thermodesulfobacteriota bacterium]